MLTSGFTHAPVSRFLVFSLVTSSILVSITDIKYLFPIQVVPHLWQYGQLWRVLTWQTCYTNSTELLFASLTLYHLRIIERLWGTRKFASFLLSTLPYNTLLPPLILTLVLRPLSLHRINYLPAGPTALVFSLLAQYHAAIPHVYKYHVSTRPSPPSSQQQGPRRTPSHPALTDDGLTFTDKSTTYLLVTQLALSQFPGSALAAAVGWLVGYAWRNDVLPLATSTWRVPRWVVGDKSGTGGSGLGGTGGETYEALRRRLVREGSGAGVGRASGVDGGPVAGTGAGDDEAEMQHRRTLGSQILHQLRGTEAFR
ncbi:MAG: hypothetical protein M1838_003491 [Thelocarpon superellum]|nr:MAG: hypothetical protein M1838_003491 [Thelocarpon superellum]